MSKNAELRPFTHQQRRITLDPQTLALLRTYHARRVELAAVLNMDLPLRPRSARSRGSRRAGQPRHRKGPGVARSARRRRRCRGWRRPATTGGQRYARMCARLGWDMHLHQLLDLNTRPRPSRRWHQEFCILQIRFPDLVLPQPAPWPDLNTAESGSLEIKGRLRRPGGACPRCAAGRAAVTAESIALLSWPSSWARSCRSCSRLLLPGSAAASRAAMSRLAAGSLVPATRLRPPRRATGRCTAGAA
jgi:hypothetical protein